VLFVGAKDDGGCAGLAITDELLRTLADMRSDGNIVPFPSMTVQKRSLNSCEIADVMVEPSDAPPVRCPAQRSCLNPLSPIGHESGTFSLESYSGRP